MLESILDSLITDWETEREVTFRQKSTEQRLLVTYALSSHTHRLARAVRYLHTGQFYLEAMPLVRAAWESSLTAHWLAQNPDAIRGFTDEDIRQHRNLLDTMAKTGWESAAEPAQTLNQHQPTGGPTQESARYFERLCEDLAPGGQQSYAIYRMLCSYTHPGGRIASRYVKDDPIEFHAIPIDFNEEASAVWLAMTCFSVVWAARAFDIITDGKRMNTLRKTAKRLGIPLQMQLSQKARQREQKARRANWRSPSPG